MSHNTSNSSAFIEAQQYSQFILGNLAEVMLPETFFRDVGDFGNGTTLNIKTVGDVTLQEVAEEVEIASSPIDTGNITLTITDEPGHAWHITDNLREDGSQIEQLHAMHAMKALEAIRVHHESKFLAAANAAQTNSAANSINGFAHRIVSAETNGVASLAHFNQMRLAFKKANAPDSGMVAIVDPVVEATLNGLTNLVNVSNNPMFEGVVTEGFAKGHKFVKNVFGWDVYVSNHLEAGSVGDGTTTIAGGVANVFMCVADDSSRPMMHAWRRMPKVEGWRDEKMRSDRFQVSTRFGFGAQRVDTLGILGTSATNY